LEGEETMMLEDEAAPTQKASPVVLPPVEASPRAEVVSPSPLDVHDTPRDALVAVRAEEFALRPPPPKEEGAPVFDADFVSEDKTAVSAPPVFWASQARRSLALSNTPTTSNQQPLIPLLSALPPAGLRSLLSGAQHRHATSGTLLCEEGSPGDSCFVVLAGEVEVWNSVAGRRVVLARLSAGEMFGELASLSGAPRCANVSALSSVALYEISGAAFGEVRRAYPAVEAALWQNARRRLLALWAAEGKAVQALPAAERDALAGVGAAREVRAGEHLVLEGALAGGVWLLVSARAELRTRGPLGRQVPLLRLGAGDFAGWGSVVEARPALASVAVTRAGLGLYFPKSAFLGVVRGEALAAAVAPWLAVRRALVEKARRGEAIALGTDELP
jgi:CRP-like cAMP-binding protein